MSMTFKFSERDYTIRSFRDSDHVFESIKNFIMAEIMPIMRGLPEVSTIRCSLSGLPIAISTLNEIEDCVLAGMLATKMDRFDDLLGKFSDEEVIEAVNSLVDHTCKQMILSWRKSPSLTFATNGSVTAAVDPRKQLAILLNTFLFDDGMFRSDYESIENQIEKRRALAAMADMISIQWNSDDALRELLNTLIELDAKYRITKIKFTRKESKQFDELNLDLLDAKAITAFVRELIDWRDDPIHSQTLYVGPRSWTVDALIKLNREMAAREKFSNVLEGADLIEVAGKMVKPPKNTEEAVKQEMKQARFDIIKSIFGNMGGASA